jgi:hypothetical protein
MPTRIVVHPARWARVVQLCVMSLQGGPIFGICRKWSITHSPSIPLCSARSAIDCTRRDLSVLSTQLRRRHIEDDGHARDVTPGTAIARHFALRLGPVPSELSTVLSPRRSRRSTMSSITAHASADARRSSSTSPTIDRNASLDTTEGPGCSAADVLFPEPAGPIRTTRHGDAVRSRLRLSR